MATYNGTPGDDSITNDRSYDIRYGHAPDIANVINRFYGEEGNDTLTAWTQDEKFSEYAAGVEYFYGGPGDDVYYIAEPADEVIESSGEGTDTVKVMSSASFELHGDPVVAMPENVENLVLEPVYGDAPRSLGAVGNALDNRIVGNGIPNDLNGGGGNDTIYGRQQLGIEYVADVADTIHGGTGNDRIYGGRSDDDREDGPDILYGDDEAWGGAGNDNLYGQSGNDTLHGGDGDERVYGGTGDDTLYGAAGVDAVRGGEGLDRLYGGGGGDRFEYTATTPGRAVRPTT